MGSGRVKKLPGSIFKLRVVASFRAKQPMYLFLSQNHEQESGESELTKNAFKILYATDEDHEQQAQDVIPGEEPLEGDQAQVLLTHNPNA